MTMARISSRLFQALIILLVANNAVAACSEPADQIRLNQLGFFIDGPKLAAVASTSPEPFEWQLQDRLGEIQASGETIVFGDDPISGDHIHYAIFSQFTEQGDDYRIKTKCAASHPFKIATLPYGALAYDALAYFYHNRSGVPIDTQHAGSEDRARPAGHELDTATCRRGRDPNDNDWPGCDYTLDLSGGWYDAGDHGKYVVNGGIATWTLLNLYERQRVLGKPDAFSDGQAAVPEAGNNVSDLLDEARFEIEFLLRMQAPPDTTAAVPVNVKRNRKGMIFTEIDASGMAHHKIADEEWTPLPTAPHEDTEQRVLYPVSTSATLNLAAVAAQCARIWREIDAEFSGRCMEVAESAYVAAVRNPEIYFVANFSGSGTYGDSDLSDEFFWAAAELFVTTGNDLYLDHLRTSLHFSAALTYQPAWPRVAPLGLISLAQQTTALEAAETDALQQQLINAADLFLQERDRSGYHIPFSTDRYNWGSNSDVLNRAMILANAYDLTNKSVYRDGVVDVMDYLLGRNPLDQSYISGYGERSMQNPHHRFWLPSYDGNYPAPPRGALSGGPNSTSPADEVAKEIFGSCAPQTCWRDDARAYALNEVAINWNAPLVWVAAFLDEAAN